MTSYHRTGRNGERALSCPSCSTLRRLAAGGPGRLVCSGCGATLEVMRLFDLPHVNDRGRWYIAPDSTATRIR
jgi:hypothetical protein